MRNKIIILIGVVLIIGVILLCVGHISQDTNYHEFSDKREFFHISNFYNVLSNIFFLIFGIWGLVKIRTDQIIQPVRVQYIIFCIGIILTAFGSFYYHLNPDNETLVWDRLPMTVVFISLFSAVIDDYIDHSIGQKVLLPSLFFGVASVLYWYMTEEMGRGDLRPYIIVQYLTILLIIIIVIMYNPGNTQKRFIIWALIFYCMSKVFEVSDIIIFKVSQGIISGHTIKHILAGLSAFYVMKMFQINKIKRGTI